jgi:multidrug resistance protein, MATE family
MLRLPRRRDRTQHAAAIRTIALPLLFQALSYELLGFVDTAVVARLGDTALAASALAGVLFLAIAVFFRSVIVTAVVKIGHAHGAGDTDGVARWTRAALVTAALLLLALPVLPPLFSGVVQWLTGGGPIAGGATAYLTVRTLELPATLLLSVVWAAFVGRGDSRLPNRLAWLSVSSNVVLDVVLVFGLGPVPALGLVGAAWATVAAQTLAAAVGAVVLWRSLPPGSLLRARTRADEVRAVLALGVPRALGDVGTVLAFTVFLGGVSRLGASALAASQLAFQLDSLAIAVGRSVAMGTGAVIAQRLGAGRTDALAPLLRTGLAMAVVGQGIVSLAWLLAPRLVLRVFTDDQHLIDVAVGVLRALALKAVLHAAAMTFEHSLASLGDTRWPAMARIAVGFGVFLPVAALASGPLGLGLSGAWAAGAVWFAVLAAWMAWRWSRVAAATLAPRSERAAPEGLSLPRAGPEPDAPAA